MEKQIYVTPETRIVKLQQKHCLLAGASKPHAKTVGGNGEFNPNITGGSVDARSRGWDDNWDD